MTEFYEDNLHTLINVLDCLEDVSKIEGVFDVEVRVRVDDVETWAVVGYGDSGEPCVLRFENTTRAVDPWPSPSHTTSPQAVVTYKNDPY